MGFFVGLETYGVLHRQRRCQVFFDSWLFILSSHHLHINDVTSQLIDDCVTIPWFTHVASPSNIADPPLRQESHPFLLQSLQCETAMVKSQFAYLRQYVDQKVKGPLSRIGVGAVARKLDRIAPINERQKGVQ